MPDAGLRLEGVVAGYGSGPPAVDGASLEVRQGEVVGLVGPNGSGKTTLVRIASRALRPRAGLVRVAGVDPYAVAAREAARLAAVVPQDVSPVFSFTALEVVLMGRSPYRSAWGGGRPEDWARVRHAMERTGVAHLADRPLEELSGGERRRVILAQALAQDAPVLLLDEPTTHLDVRHVIDLLATMRRLAADEGKAVLAVLHDLNLAAVSCDRVVALARGGVVADGPPDEVVTERLLRDVYGVEAEVHVHQATGRPVVSVGLSGPLEARPTLARAHVVPGAGRGAAVMRALAERGYDVTVGVLHATDTDAAVAERLNLLRVSVPPFSGIDAGAASDAAALMADAELLVVCDAPYGPGNVENLRLALDAARRGVRTMLLEQVPIEERDFTGGEAARLWSELRTLATVVREPREVWSLEG